MLFVWQPPAWCLFRFHFRNRIDSDERTACDVNEFVEFAFLRASDHFWSLAGVKSSAHGSMEFLEKVLYFGEARSSQLDADCHLNFATTTPPHLSIFKHLTAASRG